MPQCIGFKPESIRAWLNFDPADLAMQYALLMTVISRVLQVSICSSSGGALRA
jgi:hypothetical protein